MLTVGEYEYNPKEIIGHGAFAVVFRGRSKKNPSLPVAIKSVTKKNLQKPELLEKEIKILQELTKLHHENVVALYCCEYIHSNVFLVMEYCKGGDLQDYLQAKGTLSEDTIRIFLRQLANAMKALYSKGIVHRDLKPQNILITYDVPNPQPSQIKLKIADFGFARFVQEGNLAATLCGSPMYMAPEVFFNKQYDSRADLWSLGIIVFQCLTGNAPFMASSPAALKHLYHACQNLLPNIPNTTSPELEDLLLGILQRDVSRRISFEEFFNHKFLQCVDTPKTADLILSDIALATSPTNRPAPSSNSTSVRLPLSNNTPDPSESPRSTRITLSSSAEDDYVIVSRNIPDQFTESVELDRQLQATSVKSPPPPYNPVASPVRPSFLPVPSEPQPVPSMKEVYRKMHSQSEKANEPPDQSVVSSVVPRSQPISMRRLESRPSHSDIDIINSLSPPSVKFVIGTPPGGRRRSTSGGSLCETPPPATFWTISPANVARTAPVNSPLRRSGTSPPLLSGPLARMPILSSPNISNENNNPNRSPNLTYCTRAITLPEISEIQNHGSLSDRGGLSFEYPITFTAPELAEETLLDKEHNETLAKINFVKAITDMILKLAASRLTTSPIFSDFDRIQAQQIYDEQTRKAEKFVLLVRAMQIIGSGLAFGAQEMREGRLRPSTTVKKVMSELNGVFRKTLSECKQLNSSEIIAKAADMPAEKILYEHVVEICASAAVAELNGNKHECCEGYQQAQILLHSLASQVPQEDRHVIIKYKESVERRLYILQQQGYIYTQDLNYV